MKRIFNFLLLALFPASFLHQAYTYRGDDGQGILSVEFVISGHDHNAECKEGFLAWPIALWRASK